VHYETLNVYEQHSLYILGITPILNLTYVTTIAIAYQATLQAAIANHGIVPKNPNLVPTSMNLSFQQLIMLSQTFLAPSMHQLLLIQWGNSFKFLSWNFRSRIPKKLCSSSPSFGKRMKPSRCSTRSFSSLKRILRTSQTWKLSTNIFVHWKVLRHSMRRFYNEFLQNLETCTFC